MKSLSCVQLFATPWTVAYQAPQSMEISRQDTQWDLPDPGIEPRSPALQENALLSEPPGKPIINFYHTFLTCMCTCVCLCICTQVFMYTYIGIIEMVYDKCLYSQSYGFSSSHVEM